MGTVEFVVALEQQMELVPLRRGWWVAFGGPVPTRAASFDGPAVPAEPEAEPPARAAEPAELRPQGQRGGTLPPPEPGRRRRPEPQPPTPRPMPDPAPSPVPEPPSTPDVPVEPRSGGRRRR